MRRSCSIMLSTLLVLLVGCIALPSCSRKTRAAPPAPIASAQDRAAMAKAGFGDPEQEAEDLILRADVGWIDEERRKMEPYVKPVVEENGFDVYVAAIEESQGAPINSGRWELDGICARYMGAGFDGPDEVPSTAEVERELEAHGDLFAAAREAANMAYVDPSEPDPMFIHPWLARFRGLCRIQKQRMAILHIRGRDTEALSAARDTYALAVSIPQHGGVLQMLVGVACAQIVQRGSLAILTEAELPADGLQAHGEYIRSLRDRLFPFDEILRFEFALAQAGADMVEAGEGMAYLELMYTDEVSEQDRVRIGLHLALAFDREAVMEWLEDRYARLAEEAARPFGQSGFGALYQQTEKDMTARRDRFSFIPLDGLDSFHTRWLQFNGTLIAEETAAALAAHRAEHGEYPQALDALVPDYMPELPPDPFTGDPLVYRRDGGSYVLYSVGPDGVDHGGSRERAPAGNVYYQEDIVYVPVR